MVTVEDVEKKQHSRKTACSGELRGRLRDRAPQVLVVLIASDRREHAVLVRFAVVLTAACLLQNGESGHNAVQYSVKPHGVSNLLCGAGRAAQRVSRSARYADRVGP